MHHGSFLPEAAKEKKNPSRGTPKTVSTLYKGQPNPTQDECPRPCFHTSTRPRVAAASRHYSPYYPDNANFSGCPHRWLPRYPFPPQPKCPSPPTTITQIGVRPNHSHTAEYVLPSYWSDHTPYSLARPNLRARCGPLHSYSPLSRILLDHRPFPPIPAAVRLLLRSFSGFCLQLQWIDTRTCHSWFFPKERVRYASWI